MSYLRSSSALARRGIPARASQPPTSLWGTTVVACRPLSIPLCLALTACASTRSPRSIGSPPEIGTGLHPLAASLNAWLETSEADVALWGVHVRSLDSGEEIYNHEGGRLLLPASTMKLVNLESV